MASALEETLKRLISKSEVLVEKYKNLEAEKSAVEQENMELKAGIETMKVRIERLEREQEYLKLARNVSPDRSELERNKAMLGKLVQDIDKCISQLME